jgi:hypothetical protein
VIDRVNLRSELPILYFPRVTRNTRFGVGAIGG